MKRTNIIAVALASSLILGACIVPAWGYFTDTTMAKGGMPVTVDTRLTEEYVKPELTKHVLISNDSNSSTPVYVRARVYTSMDYTTDGGTDWSARPDGWIYYQKLVYPGETANELKVTITSFPAVKSTEVPDGAVYGDNYNMIVYYESTPAIFNNETQDYEEANWNDIVSSGTEEGGNQ